MRSVYSYCSSVAVYTLVPITVHTFSTKIRYLIFKDQSDLVVKAAFTPIFSELLCMTFENRIIASIIWIPGNSLKGMRYIRQGDDWSSFSVKIKLLDNPEVRKHIAIYLISF